MLFSDLKFFTVHVSVYTFIEKKRPNYADVFWFLPWKKKTKNKEDVVMQNL